MFHNEHIIPRMLNTLDLRPGIRLALLGSDEAYILFYRRNRRAVRDEPPRLTCHGRLRGAPASLLSMYGARAKYTRLHPRFPGSRYQQLNGAATGSER